MRFISSGVCWVTFVAVSLFSSWPAHAATIEVAVNYAHDWVSGVTDPFTEANVTVWDSGASLKATGVVTADADGYYVVAGEDWSPVAPDIQPGDRIDATVAGASATVDPVGSIPANLNADTDIVSGTVHAPWLVGPVAVRCAVWEDSAPPAIETTADPNDGAFSCDFANTVGWDLQPRHMVAVMYFESDGDSVINVPPWTWMRVHYGADEVSGDYPAGVTFDISVEDSGGAVKATAQIVTAVSQGWQGEGFYTQPGDWTPATPDIVLGDTVYFSGGDGYLGDVRVGIINGSVNTEADQVTGFLSVPWLPGDTMLDVECHPWGAWTLGFDAPIITSSADADSDPGYVCDWSADPWNLVEHQPVGVIYYELDGDGVLHEFGESTDGFIHADGFESGDTDRWTSVNPINND